MPWLRPLSLLLLLLLVPATLPARASSIVQFSIEDLARRSEFIFEGRVLSATPRTAPGNRRLIVTELTFQVTEVLKGPALPAVTLSFLGGTVGEVTITVSDMRLPVVGEHGIYFVESLAGPQVHAFLGWDQGHVLIAQESGNPRVTTLRGQPIYAVEPGTGGRGLSTGAADGLRLTSAAGESPLTPEAFKAAVLRLVAP